MNENRNNSGTAGGIGFCGLLTIAFIILKLTGVISWSWLWVLAPIWIPTAIVLAVLLVVLIVVLVKEASSRPRSASAGSCAAKTSTSRPAATVSSASPGRAISS